MTANDDAQIFEAEHVDSTGLNTGCTGAFVQSFGHALIQAPIDGVREVVNTLSGTKIVPKVELVKAPPKAEISTPEWEAQRFGTGAGLIAGLIIISKLLSRRR
jgi:hypothetical protein